MGEIENKLKDLIMSREGNMINFARKIDMPYTTLASIISRGVHSASVHNIIKICGALDISTDELADGRITFLSDAPKRVSNPPTTVDDIKRIARIMSFESVHINGEPLSNEDVQTITDALEIGIEIVKRRHKRGEQ